MKIIYLFLCLSIAAFTLQAQPDRKGKVGIGYSGSLTPATNELGISVWVGNNFSLEPQIGFKTVSLEDNSGTSWRLGLGFLHRFVNYEVSPYWGARIKTILISSDGDTYNDFVLSLAFGGEYFVSEWFSVGGEMRLNYVTTDEEYSPAYGIANATVVETEQLLNIRIYLN